MPSNIQNRARLYEKLRALAGDALVVFIDEAVDKAASQIAERIRINTPRNTGALANSVHKYRMEPMKFRVFAGGKETTKNGYDYALAVEFGTHKMAAEPFFFPNYRAGKAQARKRIKDAARKGIKLVAK